MSVYKLIVNSEMQEVKLRDQLPHDFEDVSVKKTCPENRVTATLLTLKQSPSEWLVLCWRFGLKTLDYGAMIVY